MTCKVNGKTGILTPCRSKTPEDFITEIGHIDYVAEGNTHAKFYGNRPRGARPTNSSISCPVPFLWLQIMLFIQQSIVGFDEFMKVQAEHGMLMVLW